MGIIEVTKDKTKTAITFDRNNEDRDDYMSRVREVIHEVFFWRENARLYHMLVVMFREMVKNVCDHGNGKAVLTVTENNTGTIKFEFIDDSKNIIKFTDIRDGKYSPNWEQKSRSNSGVGISRILRGYKELGIKQRIDDTRGGINYFGRYKHPD